MKNILFKAFSSLFFYYFCTRKYVKQAFSPWRDARVVEEARLESV